MSQFHGGSSNGLKRKRSECNDYFDENKKILYTEDGIPVTTLFLSSLNKEVAHHYIYEHFSTFGIIDSVSIKGKARNWFIFVTFTQFESAARAMDTQFHTIAGHQTLVEIAKSEHQIAIELTNGTGTTLLDLNDDCLNEIFSLKTISMSDLCSVARTSVRLKDIANQMFSRNVKKCRFRLLVKAPIEARRLITTFSSLIVDFRFGRSQFVAEEWKNLLAVLARCNTDSLSYLRIHNVFIPRSTLMELKTRLNELKNLEITNELVHPEALNIISEMTYPKLKGLKFHFCDVDVLERFIPRHQNLKSLCLSGVRSRLLPTIVENCKILQVLKLLFIHHEANFEQAIKTLLVLDQLRVLHIRCEGRMFVTNFIRELNSIESLEELRLQNVSADPGFIPALSQLRSIQVLRLINCGVLLLPNFDLLGEMTQLIELSIESTFDNVEINGLLLIQRLINLQILTLVKTIKIDKKMYSRIVDVVNGRPKQSKQILEINCLASHVDDFDVDINQPVKLNRITIDVFRYDFFHY